MNEELIRTTPALEAACADARAEGIVALDTEFVWSRTYLPRLGIVQMGCRAGCCALDCMCSMHTDPFASVVEDPSVVKILHDARQDLALIKHYSGASARNVFDTQLAAAFAGLPSGLGLQKLLFEVIDVGLAKTQTLTDWTQRPLTKAQLQYALDDVRYLPDLRDALIARAKSLGTLGWLMEDLATYDGGVPSMEHNPEEAWKKVKTGHIRLDGRGRAILSALAACREISAQEWNLPRNWLGDDASLAAMAASASTSHLRHRLKGKGEILRGIYEKAIAATKDLPEDEWPEDPHRHYISEVLSAADAAMDWLAQRAEEIHVDASVIASRATVTAFVDDVNDDANPLASGWRHEAVGKEMASLFGVD